MAHRPTLLSASGRVLWKIAPVLLGIIAYFGLGAIEKAKSNYDKEQAAPIFLADNTNLKKKEIFEIGSVDLEKWLPSKTWENIGPYLKKVRFRTFKNEDQLGDALSEQILAEKAVNEKKYQYRRDGVIMNYVTERIALFNKRGQVEATLGRFNGVDISKLEKAGDARTLYPNCFNGNQPARQKTGKASKGAASKEYQLCSSLKQWEELMTQIEDSDKKHQNEQARINHELSQLDDDAQGKISSIHTDLKPSLLAIKSGQPPGSPNPPDSRSGDSFLKNYNFQSVLNDNHGIHVIYQVIWLTFVVLLVFGMISVILALLRLLPSFASSSEALTDQAKSFLAQRNGAAADITRAAVVSVAAIGIGTVVVVASGTGIGNPHLSTNSNAGSSLTRNDQRRITNNVEGTGDSSPTLVPYPVPYPSPVSIQSINNIPPLDQSVLTELSNRVGGLSDHVTGLETRVQSIDNDLDTSVKQPLQGLIGNVGGVNVPSLSTGVTTLQEDFSKLRGETDILNREAQELKTTFFNKLDAASSTMENIRNDSLFRLQRQEGRNIFTRIGQLLKKERYMVSEQSYNVLVNLLCSGCRDANDYAQSPNKQILINLKNLKGQPPMSKSDLLNGLEGSGAKDVLKPWESIILRYTRIP